MEPKLCEWCSVDEAKIPATVRVNVAELDGMLLDYAYLCDDCAKRGVVWTGTAIAAHD